MSEQINPAWKQFNELNNEGGEGYNPHTKFLGKVKSAEILDCTSAPMGSFPGHSISRAEAEYLLGEETRLLAAAEVRAKCGDFSAAVAIDAIKSRVAHYAEQLTQQLGTPKQVGGRAKMKSITMTPGQTEAYDADEDGCMDGLILQAQALANETGATVEIYTADGIVADARNPE